MSYLDRLLEIIAQESMGTTPSKPSKPHSAASRRGIEGFEGCFDRPIPEIASPTTAAEPDQWQTALASIDAAIAPQALTRVRWRQLLDDARWLADQHGPSASALGWTASDLFGVDDILDGWGGLADRLRGARRAKFTDTIVRWRSDHEDGWLWRRTLRPMRTIWEVTEAFRLEQTS